MRWFSRSLATLALLVATVAPACADPISSLVAIGSWIASTVTVASVVTTLVSTAIATGLEYIAGALAGGSQQSSFGLQTTLQSGGTVPRSFPLGPACLAGSEYYPARTWGKDGKTPNAYFTRFISLADLPITALTSIIVNDQRCTYGSGSPDENLGYAVPEYAKDGKDHLWVKFYDGHQTDADAWAVSQFGDDPDYPYSSDMKGMGCAYVIVTALVDATLFSSIPQYKFQVQGIALYNPTQDSSVGGSGSQRWSNPSTWAYSENAAVAKYNVLRGISYSGQWLFGLQNTDAARLPLDAWFAAINVDAANVESAPGVFAPQFRCGGEITVDSAPADLLDELNKCDNGRLAEVGGLFFTRSGAVGSAVMSFSASDLIITESQTDDPFPGLEDTVNGIAATYPEPSLNWVMTDAPARYNADLETADGGRRLIANVAYNLVPFPNQVQMLMASGVQEARKFRKHNVIAPPRAFALGALDVIAFTDPARGYDNKLFTCVPVDQDNLDVGLALREVDPSDYNWTPESDYKTYQAVPVIGHPTPSQAITGTSFEGIIIYGDDGRAKPGGRAHFAVTDIDDVDGVIIEVRRAGGATVWQGETAHSVEIFQQGYADFDAALHANTAYEGRLKYRPISTRPTDWTDWLAFTTPNVGFERVDFGATAKQLLDFIGASFSDLLDQLHAVSQVSAEAGLNAAASRQEMRRSLQLVVGNLSASFAEQITVLADDVSALSSDVTTLTVTVAGKADTSAVTALQSLVNTQGDSITALSSSVTTLTTTVAGKADASAVTALSALVTSQGDDITALSSLTTDLSATIGGSYSPSSTVAFALDAKASSADLATQADLLADLTSSFGTSIATAKLRIGTAANKAGATATIGFSISATDGGSGVDSGALFLTTDGHTSSCWIEASQFIVSSGSDAAALSSAMQFVGGVLSVKKASINSIDADYIDSGTIDVDNLIVHNALSQGYIATQSGTITPSATTLTEILRFTVVALGGTISIDAKFAQVSKADAGSYSNCAWALKSAPSPGGTASNTINSGTYYGNDSGELWRNVFGEISGTYSYGQSIDIVLLVAGDGSKRPVIGQSQIQAISMH